MKTAALVSACLGVIVALAEIALGITDASGTFLTDYVPVGPVFIVTFEAATARVGSATGSVAFPHQGGETRVVDITPACRTLSTFLIGLARTHRRGRRK